MAKKKKQTQNQIKRSTNEIKFFQKHIVEGKSITKCSEEIGVTKVSCHSYKNSANYRKMAIAYLEEGALDGVKGTMFKLVAALDATRPLVLIDKKVTKEGVLSEITRVEQVADQNTRMKALVEINKIYGLYAPQQKDVTIAISISTDAELFEQIDAATRKCKLVNSYVETEGSFELAPGSQEGDSGDFKSRKRALLQGTPVSQSQ